MKFSLLLTSVLSIPLATAAAPPVVTITQIGSAPDTVTSMIQGADGNLYGTAGSFFHPNSAIFMMTPAVTTTLATVMSAQVGSLIQAADGNFYGVSSAGTGKCEVLGGGTASCGSIFQLTPAGVLSTFYNFKGTDGYSPIALIQASDGNFYGTTAQGGSFYSATSLGNGTIFKLTPAGVLTTLHSYSRTEGETPFGLFQAQDGNLYGMLPYGGVGQCADFLTKQPGCGVLFKVTMSGVYSILYSFTGPGGDSLNSPSSFFQGPDGTLYATAAGYTTANPIPYFVLKVSPSGTISTIITFTPANGGILGALLAAADGNLYGTTLGEPFETGNGGVIVTNAEPGTIFELTTAGQLIEISGLCKGCNPPSSNFLQAKDGSFYATSGAGVYHLSLAASNAPAISTNNGVLNGASFQPGIGAGGWMTLGGTNLSTGVDTWDNAIVHGALPTTLDGVSVTVGGQPAYIEYVSPAQINAIAPNVPAGSVAVVVQTAAGSSQAVNAQLAAESPAFFQWGNYSVATRQDFSLAVKNGTFAGTTTTPAKPGDVIILWGTGFGVTSPAAPAGMQTPSNTTYNTANAVSVKVGGKSATVYGAALAPGYAGLYQIAIQIPASLASGDYPVIATINGSSSPSSTLITVQK